MEFKVKNEAEKAIAEKLQTNLATYEELTEEERSFLHKWEVFCHYLTDDGKWKQTLGITGGWRYHLEPKLNIVIEPETFAELVAKNLVGTMYACELQEYERHRRYLAMVEIEVEIDRYITGDTKLEAGEVLKNIQKIIDRFEEQNE